MQRVDGSDWVMRDAGTQLRSPRRAPQARLRRHKVAHSAEALRAEKAGASTSDMARLIGYGILLVVALLIAVGTVTG